MLIKLILKRYLHRWKFLTVVFAGMLLSSTTMSGSIMYFDSLRDIALDFELSKISSEKMDVNISSSEKLRFFPLSFGKLQTNVDRFPFKGSIANGPPGKKI